MNIKHRISPAFLMLIPTVLLAGPEAGDRSLTLSGSGTSDDSFDENNFGISGSMGWFTSDNLSYGEVDTTKTFDDLTLKGEESIIGRAVIVHGSADDFTGQPSGGAGERVSCGVIESGRNAEISANRKAGTGSPGRV